MQIDLYNTKGEIIGKIDVKDEIFAMPVNEALVHQVLTAQMANKRLGTASTKTRGEVKRSSRKLYAQKHTGRARRGAAESPVLVGGGTAFGPRPRSYRQAIPKKMKKSAIISCLSDKASSGLLKIVDRFDIGQPRTKEMENILISLGIGTTVLIATTSEDATAIISARNLQGVKTLPARQLNVVDLLSYKSLLMTQKAVREIEELWSKKTAELSS